jgi:hypothetical protein
MELEYFFLLVIFGTGFTLPVLYLCTYGGGGIATLKSLQKWGIRIRDGLKRITQLLCTQKGRDELAEMRKNTYYECCRCCRRRKGSQVRKRKKKKRNHLKGVDLRKIAVAPRPTALRDGSSSAGKALNEAEKIRKSQAKAQELGAGNYKDQYKVVERNTGEIVRYVVAYTHAECQSKSLSPADLLSMHCACSYFAMRT